MKIAAMAEAFGVEVVPHNPLSTVSTAASLQIAASAPNFAILEYPLGQQEPPQSVVLQPAPKVENGFMHFSDKPGIGVELVEGQLSFIHIRRRSHVKHIFIVTDLFLIYNYYKVKGVTV